MSRKYNLWILTVLLLSSFALVAAIDTWTMSYDGKANTIESMTVYNGKLYAAARSEKSEVYVYDGNTWSERYDVPKGLGALVVYDNKLYAGGTSVVDDTHNGTIYAYDGTTWAQNRYFPEQIIYALAVYNDKLYVSTGENIYVFDGTSWNQNQYPLGGIIAAMEVYDGKLYVGTCCNGTLNVYDGVSWTKRYETQGFREGVPGQVLSFAVYDDKLYAGTAPEGIIYVYDGVSWNVSHNTPTYGIVALKVYKKFLYASAIKDDYMGSDGIVYTYDRNSWTKYVDELESIKSLEVYNDKLYAGTFSEGIVYERASTSLPVMCDGCLYADSSCIPFGTRLGPQYSVIPFNGSASYCDAAKKAIEPQKNDTSACQNNYECISNYCSNGVCGNLQKELSATKGLLEQIIGFLSAFFGKFFPFPSPVAK